MHPGNLRKPFDPAGPFVARRRVLLQGYWCDIGELLPEGISARRLQQMYDARKIDVANQQDAEVGFKIKENKQVQNTKPKVEFPSDWRQYTNQQLFPLVKKLFGIQPKNRASAFSLMKELEDGIA